MTVGARVEGGAEEAGVADEAERVRGVEESEAGGEMPLLECPGASGPGREAELAEEGGRLCDEREFAERGGGGCSEE